MTALAHRNQATITRWETRWQSGPLDDDEREADEREECRREDWLCEMARERKEERMKR